MGRRRKESKGWSPRPVTDPQERATMARQAALLDAEADRCEGRAQRMRRKASALRRSLAVPDDGLGGTDGTQGGWAIAG